MTGSFFFPFFLIPYIAILHLNNPDSNEKQSHSLTKYPDVWDARRNGSLVLSAD